MPIDYYEDLMPRNAPKPAPLIEVEATPLVPEVSLLFDQDKNKSIHQNTNPRINSVENKSIKSKIDSNKDVPYGNHFESYNTWKAKNAQLLSAITGSSMGPETVPGNSSTRKNISIQRDQIYNKEVYYPAEDKYSGPSPLNKPLPSTSPVNKPELEYSGGNGNFSHHPFKKIDQHQINPPSMPVFYTQSAHNCAQPNPHHQYPGIFNQTKSCFPIAPSGLLPINNGMHLPNIDLNAHQYLKRQQNIYLPEQLQTASDNIPKQVIANQDCQCGHAQCGVTANNRIQYENTQSCVTKEDRGKEMQTPFGKLPSPLDIAHVNNQAIIDLYHIINLQNEQIFMLQQQVKQVLQLHFDCEKSSKQNFNCQHCPCLQKNNCDSEKVASNDVKNKTDQNPSNNNSKNNDISKRSIGVMTSSVEKTEQTSTNGTRQTENRASSKVRQKKKRQINSTAPSFNASSHPSRRDLVNVDEAGRKKSTPNTTKKPNQVESSQVDNSFSLNEAELVIKTNSDQDDNSPNNSVHVDLQDYYSSSMENDSEGTASSSNEDKRNSESEDDSTNPPLSWTFYNRVVGQVNQILKKTPSPPQQERPQIYRPTVNQVYGLNADYETENNWSKRVTFDGPPLEDSDNNIPNMRDHQKFNQSMPHQDLQMNDGHGRMQDFMMYNFANGNTNLSFATLRYLDRYHRLPSQKHSKPPEQTYNGYHKEQRGTKKSTKKKTRNFDKYSDFPPQMNKRKSNTPSSKLLDITALKQQPKLF